MQKWTTLRRLETKRDKLSPESQALYDELVRIHKVGPRTIIDGVVGLAAADRRAYIEPYVELGRSLTKAFKPSGRAYRPPPWGTMRSITRTYPQFVGWLENRHRYKDGELHPPASDDELVALQDLVRQTTREAEYFLPSVFVDCYRICDGVSDKLQMHPDTGHRLWRIAEIRAYYSEHSDDFRRRTLVPFSGDGAGNHFAIGESDVWDIGHEDGTATPMFPSFAKFIAKAHKLVR